MQRRNLLAINFWMLFSIGCLANTPVKKINSEVTLQQYVNWAQLPEECVSKENKKKGKIADCDDYESCKKTAEHYAKISSDLRDRAIDIFIVSEQVSELQQNADQQAACADAYSRMATMMQPKTE